MFRDTAAGVNARSTPPPVPITHRWRCPLCGALYRHPWYLAGHMMKPAEQHGHALDELDAWTRAAAVPPEDLADPRRRDPLPVLPMAAPPQLAAG